MSRKAKEIVLEAEERMELGWLVRTHTRHLQTQVTRVLSLLTISVLLCLAGSRASTIPETKRVILRKSDDSPPKEYT
jgi:hypothetical protein